MSDVIIYIYDISQGLASQLSDAFLGKHISGIWHTAIVVYEKEIYFGSNGIETCIPGGTILGNQNEKVKLGYTVKPEEEMDHYLDKLSINIFHGSKYDLLHHNCNTFSNELSIWLTGKNIPSYVTNLPHEILETNFGKIMKPYIEKFSSMRLLVNQAEGTPYNNNLNQSTDLCSIYYKENLGQSVDNFLRENIDVSQWNLKGIINTLVLSIKESSSSFLPDEIIEFLDDIGSIDIDSQIVLFDVLRLFILRDLENVVILFVDPVVWLSVVLQKSNNVELNNLKCKFICNFIGKHFETLSANAEVIKIIIKFTLACLSSQQTLQTSSSLLRNIVINMSALDEETILEMSSCLIHLLSKNELGEDESTKENIVGSIYFLVKNSVLVKDLAKAQDIDKRIRRETTFCQLLHKELQ